MHTNKLFEEEINELNPGRKIKVDKICPYIKDKCIKSLCNAYAEHFETRIITLEDKIMYQNADISWETNLDKEGWKFNCGSTSEIGPDNQDSLYFKRQDEISYGRCLI